MVKEKLAFVDHSFHKKTGSTDFLPEIFRERYRVVNFYDETWNYGPGVDINKLREGNFKVIVFFQQLPSYRQLKKLSGARLIWIPMFDAETKLSGIGWRHSRLEWLSILSLGVKILSFSRKINDYAKFLGFESFYLQYFVNPGILPAHDQGKRNGLKIFFWQRTREIDWQLIKKLIGDSVVDQIIYRPNCDPGHKFFPPNDDDTKKYNIKTINDWLSREEYLGWLANCDVFFAPRRFEGIGQAFLEAMAAGLCVVSPDYPTMNEYITSGVNGLLYDWQKPESFDLSRGEEIGHKARLNAEDGFGRYKKDREGILKFVLAPAKYKPNPAFGALLEGYNFILRPWQLAKFFLKKLYVRYKNYSNNLH